MRWFRFYDDTINNPKAQRLSGDMFKAWINLLCLASKHEGELPDLSDIAFHLRTTEGSAKDILDALIQAGLLDGGETVTPHNWRERQYKSDDSKERVKRHREKKQECNGDGNVTVTPPDTDTDTDTEKKQKEIIPAVADTKTGKQKKKTRLSPDWILPDDWGDWAMEQGLKEDEVCAMWPAFRDYHVAKGSLMADWFAAWRTWVGNKIHKGW